MFFDYMEGVPIRCFYKPIFSKSGEKDDLIIYAYGEGRQFKIGDRLPVKTMWYNYPKDLMIINIKDGEYIVHIIKDGVLRDNKYISELDVSIFNEIEAVISGDGSFIDIASYEDMIMYIKDMSDYMKVMNNLESYNEYLIGKLNSVYYSIRAVSSTTSIRTLVSHISYEDICDINVLIEKEYGTKKMSLMEIKSFFLLNDTVLSKMDLVGLRNILRKKYELMYIELDIKFEEHFNVYEKQVSMHRGVLNKKWQCDVGFEKERKLGELLECLRWGFSKKGDLFLSDDSIEKYIDWCIGKINDLVKDNSDLFCNYKKWNDFPLEDVFDMTDILKTSSVIKIKK